MNLTTQPSPLEKQEAWDLKLDFAVLCINRKEILDQRNPMPKILNKIVYRYKGEIVNIGYKKTPLYSHSPKREHFKII